MSLKDQIEARRTFAIISHPDAGKTTLTEKLLLFGGAIRTAGAVKAKKATRHATSDFMEIEKQRGISVATSVMGFLYEDKQINILDTPGHADFCEDTFRTLTAVDSAIMVLDSTKGVEKQTYKLFEVCRLRNMPVLTFINKLDREGKSPFELLDEIEEKLQLELCPLTWPIGMGKAFKGVYNLMTNELILFKPHAKQDHFESVAISDLSDPRLDAQLGHLAATLREEVEIVRELYPPLSKEAYLSGHLSPVCFGSALTNFGVKELLDIFVDVAPAPRSRETDLGEQKPEGSEFSGFIFKIHANMDPKHRNRMAFLRVCSGIFDRTKRYYHVRQQKNLRFSNPTAFMAQEKTIIDEAFPGDIVGLYDTGNLQIGDALTEGSKFMFKGIPSFSPEIFKLMVNLAPMKSKQLNKGIQQLCEEGVSQVFKKVSDHQMIVGTVGALQFEVIAYRLTNEYGAECRFESLPYMKACWISSEDPDLLKSFVSRRMSQVAKDSSGHYVYLSETQWSLDRERKENPGITFSFTSEG